MSEMLFDEYFTITLDTFLYNAGIVGFIEVLKACDAKEGKNREDKKDYFMCEQTLEVRKDFLLEADLAQGYIDAVCEKFGKETSIYNTIENIQYLIHTKDVDEKNLKEKLESIIKSLTAASIKTGCETLNATENTNTIQENIEKISKSKKDFYSVIGLLKIICDDLQKEEIKKTLFMKNSMYTKIRLFWDNKSFLLPANSKNSIKNEFIKSFEKPLKENIKKIKVEKYTCIACGANTSKEIDTTFLFEVGVDTNRKKSAFWNQTPDSFICPMCNFIYSCSPLGFIDIGNNMVFVNQNDSIESILSMNAIIEISEDRKNKKYNFYNTIIQRALAIKTKV